MGVFFAGVFLLVTVLHARQTEEMSPQSLANLAAAGKPDLRQALVEYPACWPPAYPASLWIFVRLGAPVRLFNPLCFGAALLLVWSYWRRWCPGLSPALPVFLVAILHAAPANLHQQVSESLFLPIALASMLLLARFEARPTMLRAAWLGAVTAAAGLTRFFGLCWIAPVMLAHVMLCGPARDGWRERARRALAYLLPLVLLVLPWLMLLQLFTGHLSGADRLTPREFPPELVGWESRAGLLTTVKWVLKTTFIDLFSPSRVAHHQVVQPSGITPEEELTLAAVLVLVSGALLGLGHLFRRSPPARRATLARDLLTGPQFLPLHFAGAYVVAVAAVWSRTNLDPVYTRFMFPSYPFAVMALPALFIWMKDRGAARWALVPWGLLGALFVGTNLAYLLPRGSGP